MEMSRNNQEELADKGGAASTEASSLPDRAGCSSWSASSMEATTTRSLYEDTLMDELSYSDDPSLIVKTVGADVSSCHDIQALSFCFLGCESNYPYGPIPHTAQLILDSLSQAIVAAADEKNQDSSLSESSTPPSKMTTCWMLRMKLYNVQNEEYPASRQEWDSYHGIIIPGSYAAAYNPLQEAWIEKLNTVIQDEIVAHQRPTLGICFGHQILAHSFGVVAVAAASDGQEQTQQQQQDDDDRRSGVTRSRGLASKLANGSRAGRYTMSTTPCGQAIFGKSDVDLFYTHGDQVAQLPESAVSLGGSQDGQVPILSAAYFGSKEEALQFQHDVTELDGRAGSLHQKGKSPIRPFAITFQAHPEYTSSQDLGLWRTLQMLLDFMVTKHLITKEHRVEASKDAHESFDRVQKDALQSLVCTGRFLGWWP